MNNEQGCQSYSNEAHVIGRLHGCSNVVNLQVLSMSIECPHI